MKFKLFLISIFVLICFVAYQKFIEYSSLKSIDSYESCAAAKGSLIQESYPATCTTLLGNRFRQQIIPQAISTQDWKIYLNNKYGFSFQYPEKWKVYEEYNHESNNRALMLTVKDENNYSQIYISPELPKVLSEDQIQSSTDTLVGNKRVFAYKKEQTTHYYYFGNLKYPNFWIDQYHTTPITDQILSSFKFTD